MPETADDIPRRWNGELWSRREFPEAPPDTARIALALGPQPLENARHLLPPLPLPQSPLPDLPGPNPGTEFVVYATGPRRAVAAVRAALGVASVHRHDLYFPRGWVRLPARDGTLAWESLDTARDAALTDTLALCWELTGLLTADVPVEAAADLARRANAANTLLTPLGWTAAPRETPLQAASRTPSLIALKDRFARSVEMRLWPTGRRFPARDVWRVAYALGLTWGDLDLFHWQDKRTGTRLFTISALGEGPGYFLPERAAEGEAAAGLALSFELPVSFAPVAVYDRMAVALDYLRQKLGGQPATPDGAELDADRLWDDRDALVAAVREMEEAGIAPGSPAAARFF